MTAYHRPPQPLSGRVDPDEGPLAKRVFQSFGASGSHALLGFCCDVGVRRNGGRPGANDGPSAVRQALASLAAPRDMPAVVDLGDVVVEQESLEAGHRLLGDLVQDALASHDRLVVLGGGHETAFGTVSGLRRAFPSRRIGLINLDAHLDLRPPSSTGGSSGTPFHEIHDLAPDEFDYLCIGVARESNTEALFARAGQWGVQIVFDRELLDDSRAADAAIRTLARRADVIYLSVDMDMLPHYQAPGVSAPATRGVPLAVVERIVEQVRASCRQQRCALPLVDIVEVSPPHDVNHVTARSAAVLALSMLGPQP